MPSSSTSTEVVIFTDGWAPDLRKSESGAPRVGAVIFVKGCVPLFVAEEVAPAIMDRWLPRKTQIALVELFAAVLSLGAFDDIIRGKRVILFVDAEAVEGGLVKGYSSRGDICELLGLFWALVRSLDLLIYIDRVPTDMNPADAPSRDEIQRCLALGWERRSFTPRELGKAGLGEAAVKCWSGAIVSTCS